LTMGDLDHEYLTVSFHATPLNSGIMLLLLAGPQGAAPAIII
jgi:hypothetical protein